MPNGKFRVAAIYGAGAAMGFTPQQVNAMSMWQWFAALNGYIVANTPRGGEKLSEAEAADLFNWIDGVDGAERVLSTMTYWWEGPRPEPRGVVSFVP